MPCQSGNSYDGLDPFAVRLVRKMGRRLAGRFGLVEDDRHDVEQILMVAVWSSLPRFDPKRGCKEAFVTRVIRNQIRKIIEAQRAGCRDYRLLAGSLQDPVDCGSDGNLIEHGEALDASLYLRLTRGGRKPEDRTDLALDLGHAIRSLSPELRAICQLLAEGLSDTEVAQRLGISRSTFYKRQERIQQRLAVAGIEDYLN